MNSLFFLFLFLLIGKILQKLLNKNLSNELAYILNRFVIYICLPSLVIIYLKGIDFNDSFYIPIFSSWGIFFVISFLALFFAKLFNFDKKTTIAIIMISAFTNSSFLGIPFVEAFFGKDALNYAVIYDQIGSFLILSTFGIIIIFVDRLEKIDYKSIIIKIVTFPAFVALIFILIFNDINLGFLEDILGFFAKLLAPAALISIGLILKLKINKLDLKPLILALFLKLIIAPLILLIIFKSLHYNSLSAKVSLLESAMAPMITAAMLTISAQIKPKFVASALGYGIILSFLTIPLFYILSKGV
jgi:predicted permease